MGGDYIYRYENETPTPVYIFSYGYQERDNHYPAPTIYDVQDWLIEFKNMIICPYPVINEGKLTGEWDYKLWIKGIEENFIPKNNSNTIKEALSKGIDKCIEILEREK